MRIIFAVCASIVLLMATAFAQVDYTPFELNTEDLLLDQREEELLVEAFRATPHKAKRSKT